MGYLTIETPFFQKKKTFLFTINYKENYFWKIRRIQIEIQTSIFRDFNFLVCILKIIIGLLTFWTMVDLEDMGVFKIIVIINIDPSIFYVF